MRRRRRTLVVLFGTVVGVILIAFVAIVLPRDGDHRSARNPSIGTSTRPPDDEPPTTSSAPVPDDTTRLRECERRAQSARVFYSPTQTMRVAETTTVGVSASIGGTVPTSSPVPTTVAEVPLRCEVQAQLRGADFAVDPAGFQEASFLDRPTITWSWDVVPHKSGNRHLTLEIRSVAVINGRRIEGAGEALYTTAIRVAARHETFWDKTARWSGDVVGHPLVKGFGSLAAIVGAVVGALRWLQKRRRSGPRAPTEIVLNAHDDADRAPESARVERPARR